jgi:putative hemolysin
MFATLFKQTRRPLHELSLKLLELKMRAFRPKVLFDLRYKNYTVKTVDRFAELQQVLELRHEIFRREGLGVEQIGYDFDRYDLLADHVILIDHAQRRVIGTYRLLSSEFTDDFYSARQFNLEGFLPRFQRKLELGRAGIDRRHRNGFTLNLVWKGLGKYARVTGTDCLFGCGSIKNADPRIAKEVATYLWNLAGSREYGVTPRSEYVFPEWPTVASCASTDEIAQRVPPLLQSYLHAGAMVYSDPAFDADLRSTDFWMMLKLVDLDPKFRQRYFDEIAT